MGIDPRWIEVFREKGLAYCDRPSRRYNCPATDSKPRPRDIGSVRDWKETAAEADEKHKDHVCFALKVETKAMKNSGHWTVHHKLTKLQRELTAFELMKYPESLRQAVSLGCVMRLTRIGKRRLDDDNLRLAMSAFRDVTAQWIWGGRIGRSDDHDRLRVEYGQIKGDVQGVIVSVRQFALEERQQ